jgi:hypothetical protein
MAFPVSPTNGQTYTNNNITYVYDAGMGVWDPQGSVATASPVQSVAGRTGAVTLTAADIAAGTFPGAISMASTLSVSGASTMAAISASTGAFSGAVTMASTLAVTGAVTGASFAGAGTGLTGTAASLNIGGSAGSVLQTITTSATAGTPSVVNDTQNNAKATIVQNWSAAARGGLRFNGGGAAGGAVESVVVSDATGSVSALANFNCNSLGVGTGASNTAGQILATNSIVAFYSDERLKTKIGNIENALDKVDQLSGFLYVENELARELGFNNTTQQVALSAQAVQRVQPEAVALAPFDRDAQGNSKSGENYLTVQYERLVPLLVEAIKELRQEVNTIKQQLK